MPPIFNSLQFWTLVAGVVAFVARYYFPDTFPLDEVSILNIIVFLLGLIGVVLTLRAQGTRALRMTAFYNSLAFWQLVVGLLAFVLHYFAPELPFTTEQLLAVIVFVLGALGVYPELRARGLYDRRQPLN